VVNQELIDLRREWDAHRALLEDIGAALQRHGFTKPSAPDDKRSGVEWLNIYDVAKQVYHPTKEAADLAAADFRKVGVKRLACVPVQWVEGDGLDDG